MPRYKALSEDLRWVLVHMHHKRNLTVQDIERQTSVKVRTIQKILKLFHDTGKVLPAKRHTSRPFKLNQNNVDVSPNCSTCLLHWFFLLWSILRLASRTLRMRTLTSFEHSWRRLVGWRFMNQRVWRALKRRGFTLKKVSNIWAFIRVSKSQSDYDPDYKSCYGAKRFETISIYIPNWPQLSARSVCLCRWKLVWPALNIPRLCICSEGSASTVQVLFCTGKTVRFFDSD